MELFSLAFCVLFFLVCLVCGVVVSRGKTPWVGGFIVGLGLLALLPIALILPPLHPTLSNQSGTYEGTYGGGTDTYLLHPDGTFDQRFVDARGKVYSNRGVWKVSTSGSIDFDHLLMAVSMSGDPQKPEVTNFGGASIESFGTAISFSADDGISIRRISGHDKVWPPVTPPPLSGPRRVGP